MGRASSSSSPIVDKNVLFLDDLPNIVSDDSFERITPTVLSPIHENPRSRLNTAETDQIRNFPVTSKNSTVDMAAARLSTQGSNEDESIVSSLSKDDSLLYAPRAVVVSAPSVALHACPPTEVSIPVKSTDADKEEDVPEWLKMEPKVTKPLLRRDFSAPAVMSSSSMPTNVPTGALVPPPDIVRRRPNPVGRNASCPAQDFSLPTPTATNVRTGTLVPPPDMVQRPSHGRNASCPAQDFGSVYSSSSSNMPLDALFLNGSFVEGVTHRDGHADPFAPVPSKLLGTRKQRTHRRTHSNPSVTSTLLTAPTASSSYAGSEGSSVRKSKSTTMAHRKLTSLLGADDGANCCAVKAEDSYRKRNAVKEEIKFLLGIVASPIRPLLNRGNSGPGSVDLKRSKGSLT